MKKMTIKVALALAVVLMITSLTIYVLPLFGWRVDDIGSGSMEPELDAGTMVVSQRVSPSSIAVGDIIVFRSATAGNMICHRVYEIRSAGQEFITKGDAYKDPDPAPVAAGNVVGRITFHASFIGNIVAFIKTLPGLIIFLVLPGLFITGFFLKAIWRELVIYIRKTG
jgi:signal peptidase